MAQYQPLHETTAVQQVNTWLDKFKFEDSTDGLVVTPPAQFEGPFDYYADIPERLRKWLVGLRLLRGVPQRHARRRPPGLEPRPHVRGDLVEVVGDLLEPRDVVREVLVGREREPGRELDEVALRPAELRDRRLLRVKRGAREPLAELVLEERRVRRARGREPIAVDREERVEP